MSEKLTREQVLQALSQVQEPELNKDLVSLGMVKDLKVEAGVVEFTIQLTTPACPYREKIQRDATVAVEALEGVTEVVVHLSADVPSSGATQDIQGNNIRNAIAIASGKGGVGKTTVAVNIAVALAEAGASVGLLDADIYGPNVPTMMGVERIPPPKENMIVPAEAYDVKIMSIGFMVSPEQPLIWRGPMLHSAIRQFINEVEWGDLDYLVIDLPPGTGDAQLSLAQSMPLSGGVIVTLPQKISLEDARRGLEMFRAMEVPILGIVENMSYLELPDGTKVDVFGQGGGAELAQATGVPLIGSIPMEPAVREGGDDGVPIVVSKPDSKVAKALIGITEELAAIVSLQALGDQEGLQIEMLD
jgi:ATP-binding protein involved in chromosome partitioning